MMQSDNSTIASERSGVPDELARLRERIERLPASLRAELEPLADRAIEDALFRGRVLNVAKEGLERYRLELAMTRFALDAARGDAETTRRRLGSFPG